MTNVAQAALRRIMEKFSSNVRFIMICNYPEKIIPALRSRCTEFRYAPLPEADAQKFLEHVASSEHLDCTPDGISALLELGIGDLRRSLNLMQTTALATSVVNESNVYQCAGYPLPDDIRGELQNLLNQPLQSTVNALEALRTEKGLALLDILRELHKQTMLLDLPSICMANLLDSLAVIERRIAEGCSEKIQTAAIAAVYQNLRLELDHWR
jgi:replication factor C subunit 3/5